MIKSATVAVHECGHVTLTCDGFAVTMWHEGAALLALTLRGRGLAGRATDLSQYGLPVIVSPGDALAIAGDLYGASCDAPLAAGLRMVSADGDDGCEAAWGVRPRIAD